MQKGPCSMQNNGSPKDVHILILRIWEYVTLPGKSDFADVIKLRILNWGNYPGLSRGSQAITSILIR